MKNINKRSYKGQQCLHFSEFDDPPKRTYLRDKRGRFISRAKLSEIENIKEESTPFIQLELKF